MTAGDKVLRHTGAQRTRTVQSHQRNQILKAFGSQIHNQLGDACRLQLENAGRFTSAQHGAGRLICQRNVININLFTRSFADKANAVTDNSQRAQTQKVHLQQAKLFYFIFIVLGDDATLTALLQRYVIFHIMRRDNNTGGMRACVTRQALHALRKVNQLFDLRARVICLTEVLAAVQRLLQRNAQLTRNQLGDFVDLTIAHAQCLAHVAHRRARLQCAEGNNLRHTLLSVTAHHVIKYLITLHIAEVGINIRHAYTFRIQKAFEQQMITQGLDIRYTQQIGHNTACGTATSRTDRNIMATAIIDKIPDNEEVAGIAHSVDDVQLKIQTLADLLIHNLIALRQSLLAQVTQIAHGIKALRHRKLRQQQMAELHLHVAAVSNFIGIAQSLRTIAEQRLHLIIAFQIIAVVVKAHTVRLINRARRLDAQQNILRRGILLLHIMQIVCRHQTKTELLRQLLQLRAYLVLLIKVMVLNFQKVVFLAENVYIFLNAATCSLQVVLQNHLRHLAGNAGTEADNALVIRSQHVLVYAWFIIKALQLTDADDFHQVMVACIVLRQQNQMVHAAVIFFQMRALRKIHLAADNRLDACLGTLLIKFHCAVHCAMVGNRQAVHAQLLGIGHQLRDFRSAVQQAVFRMYM